MSAVLQYLNDWKAKLWSRFFCLSVYVTMYLNDHQRTAFYESLGMNTTQFNRYNLHHYHALECWDLKFTGILPCRTSGTSRVQQCLQELGVAPLQGPKADKDLPPVVLRCSMLWSGNIMECRGLPLPHSGRQGWRARPPGDLRGLWKPGPQSTSTYICRLCTCKGESLLNRIGVYAQLHLHQQVSH